MKVFRILLVTLFLFPYSEIIFAQKKITLLNGKEINSDHVEIQETHLLYQKLTKKDSSDLKRIYLGNVFSITYLNGEERVLYKQDTLIGNDFSVEEMRMFITGEQEARQSYHNKLPFVAGFAFGVAGGMFLGVYSFIAPAVGSQIFALGYPNMKNQAVFEKSLISNQAFVTGYQKRARQKKINSSLLGGGIGLVLTIITLALI